MTKSRKILTIILYICLAIVFPIALVVLLIKNKNMKAAMLVLGVIICLIIVFSAVSLGILFYDSGPMLYTDFENYEMYKNNLETPPAEQAVATFLPDSDDFDDCENVDLYVLQFVKSYKADSSLTLIATYTDEIYQAKKYELSEKIEYLLGPIIYGENKVVSLPEYECRYRGVDIKIVKNKHFAYCGYFGLLGFNDETNQIAWMFYRNSSDQTLDEPLKEWLDLYFRFEAIG